MRIVCDLRHTEDHTMKVLHYGAGVDSTAILIGMCQRCEDVDVIIFADTGGEHPETYAYLDTMDEWLEAHMYPVITRVRRFGEDGTHGMKSKATHTGPGYQTLEGNCLQNHTLPSLAYGRSSCAAKFKVDPQTKWIRSQWPDAHIDHIIGFDCTEERRTFKFDRFNTDTDQHHFPLIEWGWDRERCEAEIAAAGLPVPMKSSCWFCPAMKKHEVKALATNHPDLFQRGLHIEDVAMSGRHHKGKDGSTKGLGRSWNWRSWAEAEGLVSIEAAS